MICQKYCRGPGVTRLAGKTVLPRVDEAHPTSAESNLNEGAIAALARYKYQIAVFPIILTLWSNVYEVCKKIAEQRADISNLAAMIYN